MGLVPLGPPFLPTPVGFGFAGVLGPTRGQVANVGNLLPLLRFSGAHPPDPLPGGLCPLDPRFCPPPWAEGLPAFWAPLVAEFTGVGYSPPLWVSCGDTPHDPLDPPLPTLVGFGFAGVLGPTRGWVANGGNSPPLLNLWGDTPHSPPPWGAAAPWTPLCPPS